MNKDTIERYTEIADEVLSLIGFRNSPLVSLFGEGKGQAGLVILDERLKYINEHIAEFTTGEAMAYLRYSSSSKKDLSNWASLLVSSKKMAKERGEEDSMFVGLD
jgi:hypothetical protein